MRALFASMVIIVLFTGCSSSDGNGEVDDVVIPVNAIPTGGDIKIPDNLKNSTN